MSPSPVVANWELVLRLRRRREELGLGIKDLTDPLGFTRNYWSAIENERKSVPIATLVAVLDALEFDVQERRELLKLHEESKTTGWWSRYSALLDTDLQRLFGLEYGASQSRNYEPLLIPALLQTADYTRALMHSGAIVRLVEVDRRVELRLRRQRRLVGDDPLKLQALISEAAIRQQVGGVATLRGQLDHLIDMINQHPDTIDVRVVPFTATGCTIFGSGTVCLLDFRSPHLPSAAWSETVSDWRFINEASQINNITIAFDQAVDRALGRQETLNIIKRHRKEMR